MDAEDGTGEVSRRACISGTDGSACCLPDVLAGNVVLKGLRLINRAYREDIVISSASPIHSEGMGGVIDSEFQIGIALLCAFQCSLQYLSLDHIVQSDAQSYRIIHNSNTAICMQAVAGCNLSYFIFLIQTPFD